MLTTMNAASTLVATNGWGGHMWGTGWGWGWWMGLMMVIFWAAVIWFVVALARGRDSKPSQLDTDPLDGARGVLAERLARGEIDQTEYRDRLDALR